MFDNAMRSRVCLVAWTLLLALAPAHAPATDGIPEKTYEAERVFEDLSLDGAYRLSPHSGGFLVLDRFNHRLLHLDGAGAIKRQIGRIGQAPGELQLPMDYWVGGSGAIRILTPEGSSAVHSFSQDGEFLGVVPLGATPAEMNESYSMSIVSDSRDRFYLNQPRRGSVLTRYSPAGDEQTAIGEMLDPADVFSDCERYRRCRDRRFPVRLNRVVMAAGPDDSVVVAFTAAPIVRRYDANGELLFETRLRGGLVDELLGVAMEEHESWAPYVTSTMQTDGMEALMMIHGVSVDPATGLIYCLVGGKEIHVLSAKGERQAILRQKLDNNDAWFGSISVADGVAWLSGFSRLFRARLPSVLEDTARLVGLE